MAQSEASLLDGLYSLVSFLMTLLARQVSEQVSSGVCRSFVFAFFIQGTRLASWLPSVDPALVVVLVLVMLPVPLRTLRENLFQVLAAAPEQKVQDAIRGRISVALAPLEPELVHVRMLPYGRFLYLQVHVLLTAGYEVGPVEKLDEARQRIQAALGDVHPRLVLDVVFTADRRWVVLAEDA